MEREDILDNVAPCSLVCFTCAANEMGAICTTAGVLLGQTEGLKEFYERSGSSRAANYEKFEGMLCLLCGGKCSGCRQGKHRHNKCQIEGCFIPECSRSHKVDFCADCEEFPCDRVKTIFDDVVYNQWLDGSNRIKEEGIEKYFESKVSEPHYVAYVDTQNEG